MLEEVSTQERSGMLRTDVKLEDESFLTDDFLRQLINVGEVDILVGPAHAQQCQDNRLDRRMPFRAAFCSGFPGSGPSIINADGGSRDGTPELVTERFDR